MLIMDQRTMQVKYRIPATDIYRISLSPYFDDIAVFHVRSVSLSNFRNFPCVPCMHLPVFQSTPNRDVPEQHYQLGPQVATNHPHIVPGCLSTESQGRRIGFTKLAI